MSIPLKRILAHKIGFGKLPLPLWSSILLAGALAAAAAGQAVGPLLTGSTGGTTSLTVGQGLRLTTDSSAYAQFGAGDAVVQVDDDGTHFTAALEIIQGDQDNVVSLNIKNHSGQPASALLTLEIPSELVVEIEEEIGTDIVEAQLSATSWLLALTADSEDENLEIVLMARPDALPAFYIVTGTITQVQG